MLVVLETVECAWTECGKEFNRRLGAPGRPRKYCTDECRKAYLKNVAQREWWAREQRKKVARYGRW